MERSPCTGIQIAFALPENASVLPIYPSLIFTRSILSPCRIESTTSWLPTTLPEYGVVPVQVRLWGMRDKELTPVGVWTGVGHGDYAGFVGQRIIRNFIFKTVAGPPCTGACGISALDHEIADHPVE